jgi:hypothetical protein
LRSRKLVDCTIATNASPRERLLGLLCGRVRSLLLVPAESWLFRVYSASVFGRPARRKLPAVVSLKSQGSHHFVHSFRSDF